MLFGKLLIRGALGPFSSGDGRLGRMFRRMLDTGGDRMLGGLLRNVRGREFTRLDERVPSDLGDFALGNHPRREASAAFEALQRRTMRVG